jgi:DNA-directed RNA polymerase subunit RPC12/RpoP
MAAFIRCPHCKAQYEVTGCPPETRFLCKECGDAVVVPGMEDAEIGVPHVDCPTCGQITPGRFNAGGRCAHCGSPLDPQIVGEPSEENVLRCDRCGTRYDCTRYGPGTTFRCRTCGTELKLPLRGRWLGAGDWELDADSGRLRCLGCSGVYELAGRTGDAAFVCKPCHRVYRLPDVVPAAGRRKGAAGEDWELDVEAGLVRCHGCGYSYDVSLYAGGKDFTCPRCDKVFRMPRIVAPGGGDSSVGAIDREIILCNKCGGIHDVSDYPRGTLFSCDGCGGVLRVSGVPGEWEVDAGGNALVCSACGFHHDLGKVQGNAPVRACERCNNPFRLASPVETEVNPAPDPPSPRLPASAEATAGSAAGDGSAEGDLAPPVPDAAQPTARVLRCGACGARYDVTARADGGRFRCAGCGGVIVVPPATPAPAVEGPATASDPPPTFSDLPAAVREGRSVLLECAVCAVAYEVPAHMSRARLRCKTCRNPVTLRDVPVSGPDPLDAGHEVEVLRSGVRRGGA